MPNSFARAATVACLSFSLTGVALADPHQVYSATADGIDKVCTPAMSGATTRKPVYLVRLGDGSGGFGPWQHTSPALESRLENQTFFHGDEFATVHEGVAIFTASVVHHSIVTPRVRTEAWCFIGGKLSRANLDVVDPDDGVEYRRIQYFDHDIDQPTFEENGAINMNGSGPVPKPSPGDITIAQYKTPADLPFYSAYQSAEAGTLRPQKP